MAKNPTQSAPRPAPAPLYDAETGEIVAAPSNAVATQPERVTFGSIAGLPIVAKKYVTVPMLEVPDGTTVYCQLVDAARVLPPLEGVKPKFPGDHWASTVRAPQGQVRLMTWTAVFKSEMEKAYPDGSYVGKWFAITIEGIKRGKNYRVPAITEIEPLAA